MRCTAIRKRFPGVLALDGVDLVVEAGTIHALVGENGAGKSTLMKILSGAHTPDGGRIEIAGQPVHITGARAAWRLGIAIVYQEFSLAADLTVGENIFLGRWPRRAGWIDFARLHREAAELLGQLGVTLEPQRRVATLSVAQQQMVEIARALSQDARILILDEPSAVLTPHELETLFGVVRNLRRRGVAVIYISHRLEEIFHLADHVTVLRDGRHITTRPVGQVSRAELITAMVGRPLGEEFPARLARRAGVGLRVEGLSCKPHFDNVTFEVRHGEVFAITGLVGSGRSALLRVLFGAQRASGGALEAGGVRGPFRDPRQAMAAGLASLPEDRKKSGLLLHRSLRENLTLANLHAYRRWGLLRPARERRASEVWMSDLRIRAPHCEVDAAALSGGNQQKVLMARWMDRPHRVILLDEPTRGVDIGAKSEIYALINRLTAEGVAVLMVSSELPEVIGMADRIAVMCRGRLAGILDNSARDVRQEQIMALAVEGGCAAS